MTLRRCVPGCEAGGTACPAGQTCIGDIGGLGRCVPSPRDGGGAGDGGASDAGVEAADGGTSVVDGSAPAADAGTKPDAGTKADAGKPPKRCEGGLCGAGRVVGEGCQASGARTSGAAWFVVCVFLLLSRAGRRRAAIGAVAAVLCFADAGVSRAHGVADFQALLSRGLLLEAQGKHREAITTLGRAHALAPDRSDLRVRIAVLESLAGRQGVAIQTLRHVLAREPRNADALRELGILFLARQRVDEAADVLERAVAADPKDGVARYYEGLALATLDRDPQARAAFTAALPLAPQLASQVHYQLALLELEENDVVDARKHLGSALRASTDAETVKLAKRALKDVEGRAARAKKNWQLGIRFGLSFDSNLSLLPDDLGLAAAASTQAADTRPSTAAARASLALSLDFTPLKGKHTVGVGGAFAQTKYGPSKTDGGLVPPAYDGSLLDVYLYYAREGRIGALPVTGSFTYGHTEMWRDPFGDVRHYLSANWLRSAVTFQYRPWGAFRLSYRFALEDFIGGNKEKTPDDRDGTQHLLALESSFYLGSRVDLRLTLVGGATSAHGANWDVFFTGVALDVDAQLTRALSLGAGVASLYRDFYRSKYTLARGTTSVSDVARTGDAVFAFGRLTARVLAGTLAATYAFMHDNSSLPQLFGYTRHVFGVDYAYRY